MKYLALLLFGVSFLSGKSYANPWIALSQGDQTAQAFLNQIENKKKEAGPHPFSQGVSKESTLSAEELKGRAQHLSAKDPASQMIFESSDARSQFKMDPQQDPLLAGAEMITENALEVIGGKGTKVTRVQQNTQDETLSCEEAGDDSLEKCSRELVVKIIKFKVKKEWKGNFYLSRCSNAERGGHYLPCAALRNALFEARRVVSGFVKRRAPGDVAAALNITAAYKACVQEVAQNKRRNCHECTVSLTPLNFIPQAGIITLLTNPQNSKKLHMDSDYWHTYNSGRYEYRCHPRIKIEYEEESYKVLPDEWSSNCARLEERVDTGLCTYDSKVCTQGRQTRLIQGIAITRDCWEETYTYSCSHPAKNDCGPLRARGCTQISSACKQQVGNVCVLYSQTYQCKGTTTNTETISGGQAQSPFCLDGNCRDQGFEANNEMMSTLAQLTLLKEMEGQIQNNFIFKGADDRCSKCAVSFKDCCGSGKGWGTSIGLADCSGEERALKKKRTEGLCHYVGTYCAEKIPLIGTCIKKKSTFCCFGSKLLKAFHEQGRAQINLGWGDAEAPLCRGFTISEIQRIDFSKLDLREVYEDLMKKFNPGKMKNMGKKLEDRMQIIKQGVDPKKKQQPNQRDEA